MCSCCYNSSLKAAIYKLASGLGLIMMTIDMRDSLTVWCCWVLAGEDISNVQLPSQLSDINHSEVVSRIISDNSCEPVLTVKISCQSKS